MADRYLVGMPDDELRRLREFWWARETLARNARERYDAEITERELESFAADIDLKHFTGRETLAERLGDKPLEQERFPGEVTWAAAKLLRKTVGDKVILRTIAKARELAAPYNTSKPVKHEPFFGRHTIYGVDKEHDTPYMTRIWAGRLRLHIFHRGDADADPHDHPWNFWTFPLTSYVEEVTSAHDHPMGLDIYFETRRQVVKAFRLHYRPATHTHRVLGRYDDCYTVINDGLIEDIISGYPPEKNDGKQRNPTWRARGRIVTLVWRGRGERKWGFLKNRDGRWCWLPWKEYVYNGGKSAPCE